MRSSGAPVSWRIAERDAIYRVLQRNESTRERQEVVELANKSAATFQRHRDAKEKLEQTYWEVFGGWRALAQRFQAEGDYQLADEVRLFITRMFPPLTDQEQLAHKFLNHRQNREINPIQRGL